MGDDLDQTRSHERREEILEAMLRAAAGRRRARAIGRGSLLCLVPAVAAVFVVHAARNPDSGLSRRILLAEAEVRTTDADPAASATDVVQASAPEQTGGIIARRISDDELAGLLRESGVQMGLVRVGHEVRLVPWNRPVPDDQEVQPRPAAGDAAS